MIRKLATALLGFAATLPLIYLGSSATLGSLQSSENSGPLLFALGAATLLYGVTSVVLLALAWRHPNSGLPRLSAALGVVLVLGWGLASLDYGSLSGLEWAAVLALACVVAVVWWSLRSLSRNAAA